MKEDKDLTIRDLLDLDPEGERYKRALSVLIRKLDPRKSMGTTLCDSIMQVWVTPAFEAVGIREEENRKKVYLCKRSSDDTAYPGQWHVPGSLYRAGDEDETVATRLEQEFCVPIDGFVFVTKVNCQEIRGSTLSMVFLVNLDGNPPEDEERGWFFVDDLPPTTCGLHAEKVIPLAAKAYDTCKEGLEYLTMLARRVRGEQ